MPLCSSTLQTSSVSFSRREMPFLLKCLNSRDTFWRGCFLLRFRAAVGTGLARAHQGSGQLRTGLARLNPLHPSSTWASQHTRTQGKGSTRSSPRAARQPLVRPLPNTSFIHGEREHPLCCHHPIPGGRKQQDHLFFHLLAQVGQSRTVAPHGIPESPPWSRH